MSMIRILLAFLMGASLVSAGSDGKCRALVFSGGGDMGSYEVGVLNSFAQYLPPEEVAYDIIAGTSAGSINVLGLSLYPMGQEKEAAAFMTELWSTLNQSQVYKNWPLGIVQGLFQEFGLYDTTPLYLKLTSIAKGTNGPARDFSIATTNAMLAVPERWNQTLNIPQTIQAVMASSAFPVFLPHKEIGSYPYFDGYSSFFFSSKCGFC
jgi:predicted acylesterase/phospholipase RssA